MFTAEQTTQTFDFIAEPVTTYIVRDPLTGETIRSVVTGKPEHFASMFEAVRAADHLNAINYPPAPVPQPRRRFLGIF